MELISGIQKKSRFSEKIAQTCKFQPVSVTKCSW